MLRRHVTSDSAGVGQFPDCALFFEEHVHNLEPMGMGQDFRHSAAFSKAAGDERLRISELALDVGKRGLLICRYIGILRYFKDAVSA